MFDVCLEIGDYKIFWYDEDYLVIEKISFPFNKVKICGGDFESLLSGMTGIETVDAE